MLLLLPGGRKEITHRRYRDRGGDGGADTAEDQAQELASGDFTGVLLFRHKILISKTCSKDLILGYLNAVGQCGKSS